LRYWRIRLQNRVISGKANILLGKKNGFTGKEDKNLRRGK